MVPPEIFDRDARRRQRNRMRRYRPDERWIIGRMADDLLERLDAVRRPFRRALILGCDFNEICPALERQGIACVLADTCPEIAKTFGGVASDEDRLAFANGSFDLVIAIGTLDTVTDLPGALALIHRALKDGGLFLGTMMGADSLPALRSSIQDLRDDRETVMRFHPQIDVRGAGDLLARAAFQLPVADSETVSVRYSSFRKLIDDLRANGLTNVLSHRKPLTRSMVASIERNFGAPALEKFSIITLTGWARSVR
jgi:SAM-dependent methyltransferase